MEKDNKRLTIPNWAEDDRPREKMLLKGAQSLSDAELLAILIAIGNMHDCSDNLNELARLSIADLCKRFKGIGQAKAITIMAAMELGKRRKMADNKERKQIKSSIHLFELFEPHLADLPHEEFWLGMLNSANKVIDVKRLTQGGTRQTVVDVPMLLKMAIEKSAAAVVVAHNHPSGQNHPSREDEEVTRRIKEGCQAVGIILLDHIIIAHNNYYSFSDEGKT